MSKCQDSAIYGGFFAALGMVFVWQTMKAQKNADLLMEDRARRTNAKIMGKRHYVTQSENHDTDHYVASYTFDGVRDDGMRCHVTIKDRHMRKWHWDELEVGQDKPVLYTVEDPGRCRLARAAVADSEESHFNPITMCFLGLACFFLAFSAFCGFYANGISGALYCISFFFCFGCFCTGCIVLVKPGDPGPDVKELGLQTRAAHLGDLSGLWLLASEFGNFEYNFKPTSTMVVMVKGRPEGKEDWDLEFEAHFAGEEGNEMVWDDDEKAHFCLLFDSSGSFTGSRCDDVGNKVTFKGSRISPAVVSAK